MNIDRGIRLLKVIKEVLDGIESLVVEKERPRYIENKEYIKTNIDFLRVVLEELNKEFKDE